MANIAEEYYRQLRERQTQQPAIQPVIQQPAKISVSPTSAAVQEKQGPQFNVTDVSKLNFISNEEQIKRYGGVVGSKEYYDHKAKQYQDLAIPSGGMGIGVGIGVGAVNAPGLLLAGPMGQSLKRNIDQESWDRMSRIDQVKTLALGLPETAGSIVATMPIEIIKAPLSVAYTVKQLIKNVAKGDPIFSAEKGRVSIPSWMKTRQEAIDQGYGELGADFLMISKGAGDLAIAGSLVAAVRSGLRPKFKTPEEIKGQQVVKTEPIKAKYEVTKTEIRPSATINEYRPLENSVAKKYGGNASNTFLKLTNAGEGMMELSVVRRMEGKISAGKAYVKSLFGNPQKVYRGATGPEIKITSQTIKTSSPETAKIIERPVPVDIQEEASTIFMEMETSMPGQRFQMETGEFTGSKSTFPEWMPEKFRNTKLFQSFEEKLAKQSTGETVKKFTKKENQLFEIIRERVAANTGRKPTDISAEMLWNSSEKIIIRRTVRQNLKPIPLKPQKGFENSLIKPEELENINTLAKAQGLAPEIIPELSKIITGKSAIGDLTHAEYVNLAQTMGTMTETPAILKRISTSWFGKHLSATGRHAARLEETTGVPIFTDFWEPIDNAFRLAKREEFAWSYRKNELWGEYNAPKYSRERDLVADYIEGNKKAIIENKILDSRTKADLIKIAEGQKVLNAEYKKFYDIKSERYGENYTPWFQEVGGRYQIYLSDIEGWPTLGKATPRYYRTGGVSPVIRDPSINFDNAIRWLVKEKYVGPVLKQTEGLYKAVDSATGAWMKKQVGYRLGYATEFDRWLNNFGTTINRWSGLNLPPDILRNFYDDMMSITYASALGLPRFDAPVRDFVTTNMIRYGRLGERFYGKATKEAFSPENIKWAREKGWLVEYGVPGGEELALAKAGMGRARATLRQGVESTMSLYQAGDNRLRIANALQQKYLFEEALDKYNAGKISWERAEKDMMLDKFSKSTQNIVRERIFSGNREGALDHMITQVIDEISFPYRMGAGAPATFGTGGRMAFHLGTWNIHFFNTVGRWARTGQWDNFIRFMAIGAVTNRSFERAFNIDASKFTTLARIMDPTLSPVLQFGSNLVQGLMAMKDENRTALNENWEAIIKTLSALGGPAGVPIVSAYRGEISGGGVGVQRWLDFWKSVKNYEKYQKIKGVEPNMFPVFDQKGNISTYMDFADILWKAFGFVPMKSKEERVFSKQSRNAQLLYQQKGREKAVELIKEAMFTKDANERIQLLKEADEVINEWKITGDLGKSVGNDYKPYIMRQYQSLSPALKERFKNWYNELINQGRNK